MQNFIIGNSIHLSYHDKLAILKIVVDNCPICIMSSKKDTDINLDYCDKETLKLIHSIVINRMEFLNNPSKF